jgi:hypothetical protein
MRSSRALICLFAGLLACTTSGAAERFGVGFKAGTLGLGIEFTGAVNRWFALRGTWNQYDTSRSFDKEAITYDGKLKVGGYGVLADFYPSHTKFRLTVGILRNRNKVDLTSTPTSDVMIGDTTYTPQEIGTIDGEMTFRSTVPYFGIGYGNAAKGPHRVGFILDVGVEPQGSPRLTLAASGGGVPQSELQKESAKVEDDSKSFKIWPVIALGISIRI